MRSLLTNSRCIFSLILFVMLGSAFAARGQNPSVTPAPAGTDEEVIRINSELVQTDVMVYDKKGNFVDGLKPEQFELKINGQARPIPFFQRVTAGSLLDTTGGRTDGNGTQTGRGRTIIFFVDDVHLSPESLIKTRQSLLKFISESMAANDQVAITSTSGQIGFLQQFTDDKDILREAVAKLGFRATHTSDGDKPPMSEYQAAQIRNGDKQTFQFFVEKLMDDNTVIMNGQEIHMVRREGAESMVMNRAREVGMQAGPATEDTLRMLEGLMRTVSQLPGRKLVFMVSDGFMLVDHSGPSVGDLKRITDAAGRAGVVIFTLDARGMTKNGIDATPEQTLDVTSQLAISNVGELASSQDGLNALARDTGGTPLRNTNVPMSDLMRKVVAETSVYYLLAWQPGNDEEKSQKFKQIEVSVIGHPELTVRVRNGYFMTAPLKLVAVGKKSKDPVKARENEIRSMIDTALPVQEIPTRVGVTVIPVLTNSSRLTASIVIDRSALTFADPPDQAADMDIGAIFYNQKGKPVDSFVGRIRVLPLTAEASERERAGTIFVHDTWLAPGLYQVRVAVRDTKSGRVGTAAQWVEVAKL